MITQASTLDPDPRSLKIPAEMAAVTSVRASSRWGHIEYGLVADDEENLIEKTHTVISFFQPVSNTAIAAREPDPIVTYGSW